MLINATPLNVSGRMPDGTAALPGLAFEADPDTGLYRLGANSLGLIVGGVATQGITIDSAGKVGVGTAAPNANIEIKENAVSGTRREIQRWSTESGGILGLLVDDLSRGSPIWSLRSGSSEAIAIERAGGGGAYSMYFDPVGKVLLNNITTYSSNDPILVIGGTRTGAGNAHAFVDEASINKSGTIGYNSFDNRVTIVGTNDYDHEVGFQAAATYSSAGSIDRLLGVTFAPTITAGTVDKLIGYRVNDAVVTGGTINNFYGLYFSETLDSATNNWSIYSEGTTKSYFGGNVGIGTEAPATRLHALLTSAATNAVTNVLTIGHDSSGTAAAGFGAGQLYTLESSTTAAQNAARIQALWYEATHATRKADLVLSAYDTAEREGLRIRGNGSAPAIGFYGHAPSAQPAAYTPSNVSADRAFDADTVAVAELADVVGTLIGDLQSIGLLQ